ncbi:uncharacterized protein (TIGR03034 family) [Bacillus pakistanensis]|uniref:Uncharacterized protein (TIGR03034 family) n=1 Tax=Rossellomorea pakistanensis TaxID=992288 RepID=A0ABS2NAM0_9BACI|nr:DUF3289 family protein [Bacillus pakistanensis]MBM7584621.1 uncharacterized protein (TIGR03034 family) [Bacillus pakistanensis]
MKNKVNSFLLCSVIVFGGIGQTVVAKGIDDADQGQQKNFSEENVKQWLSEYEFYEDTRDGLIYDKVAVNELKKFLTVIKDKNAKLDSNALDNLIVEFEKTGDFKQEDMNELEMFEQLINQYEQAVQTEYLKDVVLKSDQLLKIKHKLTIYLWGYASNNDFNQQTEVLLSDILFNFYLSDKIINKNAIGILKDIADQSDEDGNKIKAHLNNAIKMTEKANGFLEKDLGIPASKSYQNAYKQVLFGLEKAGYTFNTEFFESTSDTDGDTITDGIEFQEGMNPFIMDSDGDGLKDNIEYENKSSISPTKYDTDLNLISDADEDIDGDGLNNKDEQDYQTSLIKKDSDQDGLTDGFEVQQFDSLPYADDTDGDGLSDGDEFALKTDPNDADSDNDEITDSQELHEQSIRKSLNQPDQSAITSVEVSFSATDNIHKTTRVTTNKGNIKKANLYGLIGSPVRIITQSEFDKASITFTYDEAQLGDTLEDDLALIWYNEDEEMFESLDAVLDTSKNTLSIETAQLSEYMMVDKKKWLEFWSKETNYSRTLDGGEEIDSDGDGLYDFYEIGGMKTPYGIIHSDPDMKDTDGDGLTDGQEMGPVRSFTFEIFGITIHFEGFFPTSFPDQKDSDGDGILDNEDARPLYSDLSDLIIFQSDRPEGHDENGNVANDMKTDDYTGDEMTDISWMFHFQLLGSTDFLFKDFEFMSTSLFSKGEMEDVILDMIDHFEDGSGTDYSNQTLTDKAFEHETTKDYVEFVKNALVDELKKNGGNLAALQFDESTKATNEFYQNIQDNASYPTFSSWDDRLGGLTITVNDTWGNTISVKEFSVENNHFEGVMHVRLYDHFGLDQPDVEKVYVNLAGFRAWFVLQHHEDYDGKYKPFVTLMEMDIPFEGELSN